MEERGALAARGRGRRPGGPHAAPALDRHALPRAVALDGGRRSSAPVARRRRRARSTQSTAASTTTVATTRRSSSTACSVTATGPTPKAQSARARAAGGATSRTRSATRDGVVRRRIEPPDTPLYNRDDLRPGDVHRARRSSTSSTPRRSCRRVSPPRSTATERSA